MHTIAVCIVTRENGLDCESIGKVLFYLLDLVCLYIFVNEEVYRFLLVLMFWVHLSLNKGYQEKY